MLVKVIFGKNVNNHKYTLEYKNKEGLQQKKVTKLLEYETLFKIKLKKSSVNSVDGKISV